jgi:hypothetical protein
MKVTIPVTAAQRKSDWRRNCQAMGPSAGQWAEFLSQNGNFIKAFTARNVIVT